MSDNTKKIIRENELDFLYELYLQGVGIGEENKQKLIKHNYIPAEFSKKEKESLVSDHINKVLLNQKTDKNKEADSQIDILNKKALDTEKKYEILTSDELDKRRNDYGHIFEGRTKAIEKKEWLPKSHIIHDHDFIDWINSINRRGFKNKIQYRKFSLYCQQAYTWLSDGHTVTDFEDDDQQEDYKQQELQRCNDNNLYFLNKYIWYQEGNAEDETGKIKYIARPIHEVMAYLDDCGYSVIIAKARQIAASTTIMSIKVRNVIFKTNNFIKFISEDDEKAIEIFEDKLKFPFYHLEDWMRPNVLNERDNLFKIGYKLEKGKKEGVGSKIQVSVPKRTAIAGGAPQEINIDEAGNIQILGVMMGNARPTMYWTNPRTGKLELKRKIWVWGTGGLMEKGGKAFETEFMAIQTAWDNGDYSSGIIPLFFDWTCRFGATQEDYDTEKKVAYAKAENPGDPKAKQHIVEFYQTWPTTLSDVFRTGAKTLIDEDYIEAALQRIRDEKKKHGHTLHQSGFFEPIYDTTIDAPEGSDTPFKIIGANFIPTEDIDARASTVIFLPPKKEWIDRYYQGTDPIDTDTGLSDFSSAIWDKYYKTQAALLCWRVPDYPQVFLQGLLLNIYYDDIKQKGTRELIESNRGSAYYQYVKQKGYGRRAVMNHELPDYLQNRTTKNEGIGIDSHGDRTTQIINIMFGMFKAHGQKFFIEKTFEQAKTFTCKISDHGKEMWGPINKKYFKDDSLWSTTYSYICSEMCFDRIEPRNIDKLKNETRIVSKLVRGKDLKLSRVFVKEKIYNG